LSRGIAELDLHLLRREGIGDDPSAAYESLEDIEERPPTPDEERRLRELAADLQPRESGARSDRGLARLGLQLGYEAERPMVIDIGGVDDITMMWSYGLTMQPPLLPRWGSTFPWSSAMATWRSIRSWTGSTTWSAIAGKPPRYTPKCATRCSEDLTSERGSWWQRLLGT
jgi:hypothetical protein